MDEDAAHYLAAAVIEQGVRDWRAARHANLIDMNGETIHKNLGKLTSSNAFATFETVPEVKSLKTFFFDGGVEIWIAFAGFKIDVDLIVGGLEKSVNNSRQYLHWHRQANRR